MKITADTNLLARAIMGDDEQQSAIARRELAQAELVALALPALCELVWILLRGYKIPAAQVATAIRKLIDSENVEVNRLAVEAGLEQLEAGGDFADGVIVFEGLMAGADTFVSFDKKAVELTQKFGFAAEIPV